MKTSTGLPWRRSIRLKHFDYASDAAYFVTICSHQKRCTFGEVDADAVRLSQTGRIILYHWMDMPNVSPGVILDELTIMPNHMHAMLSIAATPSPAGSVSTNRNPRGSLGRLIGTFKGNVTKEVRIISGDPAREVWQRGYWESVIRDDRHSERIRKYIRENPARWAFDRENPELFGLY